MVVEYPKAKTPDVPALEVKQPNIDVVDAVPSVVPGGSKRDAVPSIVTGRSKRDAAVEEEFWSREDAPPKKKNKNKGRT